MFRFRRGWLVVPLFSIACGSPQQRWGVRDLDTLTLPTHATTATTSSVVAGGRITRGVRGNDRDGDGLVDEIDRCPDEPGNGQDETADDGCPEVERPPPSGADTDGDGIRDDADLCPNDPEDKDGFEDSDGCPDLDNDRDGVPDAVDACPNVAATTPTGCPNPVKR
jgi:hypothetical protein